MTQRHLTVHHHDHDHDEEDQVEDNTPSLPAKIFDARYYDEKVPEGFDSIKILVDGSLKSDLNWKKASVAAENYVNAGHRLFWEIDLDLSQFLTNSSQFLSLALSLEHFRDTLWKNYRQHTIGLCLYRGPLDLSTHFQWGQEQCSTFQEWLKDRFIEPARLTEDSGIPIQTFEEITPLSLLNSDAGKRLMALFYRDVRAEYLELLAMRLPDQLNCFALFEETIKTDPLLTAQLLTKDRYPRLSIGFKGNLMLGGELGWERMMGTAGMLARHPNWQSKEPARIGICLPAIDQCSRKSVDGLSQAIQELENRKMAFRMVTASRLTAEWDGLDYLVIPSQAIDAILRRKLLGFCAAGGIIVSEKNVNDLPNELNLVDFFIDIEKNTQIWKG